MVNHLPEKGAASLLNSNAANYNRQFNPTFLSENGFENASSRRILAHELGHGIFGDDDNGWQNLNNVWKNENPVMEALGHPKRWFYYKP